MNFNYLNCKQKSSVGISKLSTFEVVFTIAAFRDENCINSAELTSLFKYRAAGS